ncbi:MAG: DUF6056 family protein [Acetatifactor sp.]
MTEKKSKKILGILTIILLGISILVMYLTHRRVPFMMDDLWYSTMLSEDTPIRTFGDIVKSQIWHYKNWGGRSMTHGILQLTLLTGEQIADILNIIFTLLLSGSICLVARQKHLGAFFGATAMVLGLNANWKMSMFWQAGAANYLYITVFILLFVFCYLREVGEDTTVSPLPGIVFWILPLGILAGWSNENMGPAVWLLSVAVILTTAKKKSRIPCWMLLGSISSLFGSIMVIVAPGNFVRSSQAPDREYGFLWRLFMRCYAEGKATMEYLFPTLLVLAAVLLVGKCALKIPIGRQNIYLLLLALLSWGAMVLSPHYPDRASFGTMVFMICVIISMTGKILEKRKDLLWPMWAGSVLIWLRGMYMCGEFLAMCWGWIKYTW